MRRRLRSTLVAAVGVLIGSVTVWSLVAKTPEEAALSAGAVVQAPATPPFTTATRPVVPRSTPAPPLPSTPPPAISAPPAPSQAKLVAVDLPAPEGDAVLDGEGHRLYRYVRDTADPPTSNCLDACTETWAPLLTTGLPEVTGIDINLVSTLNRPEGTTQVTLGGWPLYRLTTEPATPATRSSDGTEARVTPGAHHRPTAAPPGYQSVLHRTGTIRPDELAGRSRAGETRLEESPDSTGQGGC